MNTRLYYTKSIHDPKALRPFLSEEYMVREEERIIIIQECLSRQLEKNLTDLLEQELRERGVTLHRNTPADISITCPQEYNLSLWTTSENTLEREGTQEEKTWLRTKRMPIFRQLPRVLVGVNLQYDSGSPYPVGILATLTNQGYTHYTPTKKTATV